MRQRVAVEPAGERRGSVTRRHGVECSAATRLKRRAGVSSASPTTPMTSARLCERSPSSIAHNVSESRPVSTNSHPEGSRPRAASPRPYGDPSSCANWDGQHHRMRIEASRKAARLSSRRTASLIVKPSAAAQSPAATPSPFGAAFTSCRAAASSAPPMRWSNSDSPSVHAAASVCGSAG